MGQVKVPLLIELKIIISYSISKSCCCADKKSAGKKCGARGRSRRPRPPAPFRPVRDTLIAVGAGLVAAFVVFVPAGELHAIGADVFLLELQQPEDLSILLDQGGWHRGWHDRAADSRVVQTSARLPVTALLKSRR